MPYKNVRAFTLVVTTALAMAVMLASAAGLAQPAGQQGSAVNPAPASPAQNPNVTVEQYEDWKVICPKSNQSQSRCKMTQLVNNPQNQQPIMRVVMAYPRQTNGPVMVFVTPLGTRLAPGLTLSVGGESNRFPFRICLQEGCRADYPLDQALLSAMKQGLVANVQLVGPKGEKINLDVSLQGFTSANAAIRP